MAASPSLGLFTVSTSTSALSLPQRGLLSVSTAAAMRQALAQGLWDQQFPSERRLCELFRVSRPTVRAALDILARERAVGLERRRRKRLLPVGTQPAAAASRKIVIVTQPHGTLGPVVTFAGIEELQADLRRHGFETEVFVCRGRGLPAELRQMTAYLRQNAVRCVVLVTVRRELQQWFAGRPVPTLVLGSCDAAATLPSFDVDHRAVCRHAAGVFLSRGHRRLALIVPESPTGGDLAAVKGFREAVPAHGRGGAEAVIVYHRGTTPSLTARLDALFRSPRPPTALLVAHARIALITLVYLLNRGLAVPDRVSLISRDQDVIFADLAPAMAHYAFDVRGRTRRMVRLILRLVQRQSLPTKPNLIFPRFVAGGTLRSLRG